MIPPGAPTRRPFRPGQGLQAQDMNEIVDALTPSITGGRGVQVRSFGGQLVVSAAPVRKRRTRLNFGLGAITGMFWHPDGHYYYLYTFLGGGGTGRMGWSRWRVEEAWNIATTTTQARGTELYAGYGWSGIDLHFSSDGLLLYYRDNHGWVNVFTLLAPWGVWGGSYRVITPDYLTYPQPGLCQAFTFSSNGVYFYSSGYPVGSSPSYGVFSRVTLSTPWDIASGGSPQVLAIGPDIGYGLVLSTDGTSLYHMALTPSGTMKQWALSTPWDVTTAVNTGKTLSVYAGSVGTWDIHFKADGTRMWVSTRSSAPYRLYQYNLSVPWDISTATLHAKAI